MDSSTSDEEDCQLEFWNNWLPKCTRKQGGMKYMTYKNRVVQSREALTDFSRAGAVISFTEDSRFGNWTPPPGFLTASTKDGQLPVTKTSQKQFVKDVENLNTVENYEVTKKVEQASENSIKTCPTNITCTTAWRKEMNLDWGKRIQLHDVTKYSDGNIFWGVVNLGIFGNIQLWVNEYGYICCSASGKISKIGSSESTYISINSSELLRKMLSISSDQWASLCETVKATKIALKFNAFEDCDMQKRSPLERLWFFICKRRHLLPRQCMLLKFGGAIKCMRKLEITPKLLVQDIRYIK